MRTAVRDLFRAFGNIDDVNVWRAPIAMHAIAMHAIVAAGFAALMACRLRQALISARA